jgi:CRP-like cAMP-binding protein
VAQRRERPLMKLAKLEKNDRDLDPRKLLATIGKRKQVITFLKMQTIFTQGDVVKEVYYIQEGKV